LCEKLKTAVGGLKPQRRKRGEQKLPNRKGNMPLGKTAHDANQKVPRK